MVFLEDFTRVSTGLRLPIEGRVERCLRCGRSGIEGRSPDGIRLVIHSQTTELLGDGMLVVPRGCCAVPLPSPGLSRRTGKDPRPPGGH